MQNRLRPLPGRVAHTETWTGISDRNIPIWIPRILGGVPALLIMLALKHHYSLATADQLVWILAPTARLVAWFTPAQPVFEAGVGYVDFTQGIIVAPACAGINFMIMAFGLAALCGLAGIRRTNDVWIWLVMALFAAYGYTLLVNASRIALSMVLYRADLYGVWLTAERVHRLAGIGLYLGALWLFFMGLQPILSLYARRSKRQTEEKIRSLPGWLPLGWYVMGTVGVPLANLLFQQHSPSLGEHCLTILITGACIWVAAKLLRS